MDTPPGRIRPERPEDGGASFVEVGMVTTLAATIILAIAQSEISETINDSMREVVCLVEGPECGESWTEHDRPDEPEEYNFAAGTGGRAGDNEENKKTGKKIAAERGFTGREWDCLETLWSHESNWDHNATNPSSGAHGIPQSLPGNKMSSHGSDWRTNPVTQIEWGLDYIEDRYNTPCEAWAFWQNPNGGPPGASANWY
ncbi:hypothetical protein F4561_000957 [Lipingzhangella halophila]|uniref:Transglycosylase SLT domain-containing protein n=1 Tax=Lipingzhangella halophila TaxID=1783352 RepID=A0A7W7RDS7_9ACTN|nr:transglycosylase SLT domain-containing protein [Lipingzhangella halophila]MBB4930137.1 hypothetical protein [Lipingzhangella halophila]